MILAVDFDGTICTDAYPRVGRLRMFARPTLRLAARLGCTIVLWTCREGTLDEALAALRAWGVPYHYVNANTPERIEQYGGDCRKVSADLIIDDRAAGWWCWPMVAAQIVWRRGMERWRARAGRAGY